MKPVLRTVARAASSGPLPPCGGGLEGGAKRISRTRNGARSLKQLLSIPFVFFVAVPCFAGPTGDPTYWKDVRPILRKNCTVCHSARNLKEIDVSGGLALDSYEAVLRGGKHPVLVVGKSDASQLIRLVSTTDDEKRMPLAATPLPPENIALIRRWIDRGAIEGAPSSVDPVPAAVSISRRRHKVDVVLATDAVAPKGIAGSAKSEKLSLDLRVGPLAPVTALAFSPTGRLLATGTYGQVTIWDLTTLRPVKALTNVLGAVNDVRFSPDGKLLAVGGGQPSAKGDLRVYDATNWKQLASLGGHTDVVFCVAFHPDGKHLASASFDKTVRLWNLGARAGSAVSLERTFAQHSDVVYAVAFSPDGNWLASCSRDRSVRMVDVATGKSLHTFGGMADDVQALAVSPNGQAIVSSGFQPALVWWNPRTGSRSRQQPGHAGAVHEICFSPDGKFVASASADKTVRLWDGASGVPLRTLRVGSVVYAVAVSPDGKLVASGSFDGLVRLWDRGAGRHLLTLLSLPAKQGDADWLALAPEGYLSASPGLAAEGRWLAGKGQTSSDTIWAMLRQPEMIARAAHGDRLSPPALKEQRLPSQQRERRQAP
jgi:WD40 repeat protein